MKERPIIFSGPMVRAILEDRKTVTRRPIKPQPPRKYHLNISRHNSGLADNQFLPENTYAWASGYAQFHTKCPYGDRADELWVREAFCYDRDDLNTGEAKFLYRATEECAVFKDDGDGGTALNKDGTEASPWQPSIHMPREASRIQLVVKSVRAERLQDITGEDCIAEGMEYCVAEGETMSARHVFNCVWHSLYSKKPELQWNANPWVWRVEFERKAS